MSHLARPSWAGLGVYRCKPVFTRSRASCGHVHEACPCCTSLAAGSPPARRAGHGNFAVCAGSPVVTSGHGATAGSPFAGGRPVRATDPGPAAGSDPVSAKCSTATVARSAAATSAGGRPAPQRQRTGEAGAGPRVTQPQADRSGRAGAAGARPGRTTGLARPVLGHDQLAATGIRGARTIPQWPLGKTCMPVASFPLSRDDENEGSRLRIDHSGFGDALRRRTVHRERCVAPAPAGTA